LVDDFLSTVDAWALPVTLTTAFTHRPTGTPISVDGIDVDYWLASGGFTAPFSLTGHPVVVLPAGTAQDGMPVGVQLVGKRGSDRTLLALARQLVTSR
jgi:amidase